MFQFCQAWTNKQKTKAKSNGHDMRPSYLQLSPLSVEPGKTGAEKGTHSAILIYLLQHLIRDDQAPAKAGKFGHSSKLWFLFLFLLSW